MVQPEPGSTYTRTTGHGAPSPIEFRTYPCYSSVRARSRQLTISRGQVDRGLLRTHDGARDPFANRNVKKPLSSFGWACPRQSIICRGKPNSGSSIIRTTGHGAPSPIETLRRNQRFSFVRQSGSFSSKETEVLIEEPGGEDGRRHFAKSGRAQSGEVGRVRRTSTFVNRRM